MGGMEGRAEVAVEDGDGEALWSAEDDGEGGLSRDLGTTQRG
jgi:hypothetical protein